MQSCRAFWPEMDWDSGLWRECSCRAFCPEMDRQWPAMHSLCFERQAMRSCRAFWPEMDRQWPAMHSGVGQWTWTEMDYESRFSRQWSTMVGSGYELLNEAPASVAPKRALVTCCDP